MKKAFDRKNRKIRSILILALLTLAVSFIHPQARTVYAETDNVRVLLSTGDVGSLVMSVKGSYFIEGSENTFSDGRIQLTAEGDTVTVTHSKQGVLASAKKLTLRREKESEAAGSVSFRVNGYTRKYLGSFVISASGGVLQVVNILPVRQYLYGVVGYEMSNTWPIEALKAQAIAAKNYVLSKMGGSSEWDVKDTAADQVYKGYVSSLKNVIRAVDETIEVALYLNDTIMPCWYAASNGGFSILPSEKWGDTVYDAGYFKGEDAFDLRNKASRTEKLFISSELKPRQFSSGELYQYIVNRITEAVGQSGVLKDGYVFKELKKITGLVSVDKNGGFGNDGNHDAVVITAEIACMKDPAATAAVKQMQAPVVTLSPRPTVTPPPSPAVTATPVPRDMIDSAEGEEDSPTATPTPKPKKTPKPTNTPKAKQETSPAREETTKNLIYRTVDDTKETVSVTVSFEELKAAGFFTDDSLKLYYAVPEKNGWTLFHGRYGHGVGMSQRGAQQMAREGYSFIEILAYYYPGGELKTITYGAEKNTDIEEPEENKASLLSDTQLYSMPSYQGDVIEKISAGDAIRPVGFQNEWYEVISEKTGNRGFIFYKNMVLSGETGLADGYITGSLVNIRTGPGTDYDSIAKVDKDDGVRILAYTEGWYRIKTADGMTGYVSADYLTMERPVEEEVVTFYLKGEKDSPAETPAETAVFSEGNELTKGIIALSAVKLKAFPSEEAGGFLSYGPGEEFAVLAAKDGWYQVRHLKTGREGWIPFYALQLKNMISGEEEGRLFGTVLSTSFLRNGPDGTIGETVCYYGEEVSVRGSERGWFLIETDTGKTGWIYESGLRLADAAGGQIFTGTASAVGITPVYEKASENARVLTSLYPKTKVAVLRFGNGWTEIRTGSRTGWCKTSDLVIG